MKKLTFILILVLMIGCMETLHHPIISPVKTNAAPLTNLLSITQAPPITKRYSLLSTGAREQIKNITTKPSFLAVKSLIYYLALFSACFALWWFILRKKLFSTNKPRNGGSK